MKDNRLTPFRKSIFVISNHPITVTGIRSIIREEEDLEFCGSLARGRGSHESIAETGADALLLDFSLGDCSALDLIKDLRATDCRLPLLVLSALDETLYAERALKAGANGFLMANEPVERLCEGLRTIIAGEICLSRRMQRLLLKRVAGHGDETDPFSITRLSDRELQIFERIGNGIRSGEIARLLGISPKTVDAHRANIKVKLGFSDGAELVHSAVRWVESGWETGKHCF